VYSIFFAAMMTQAVRDEGRFAFPAQINWGGRSGEEIRLWQLNIEKQGRTETKEPPLIDKKPCNCAGKEAHTIVVFDGGKPVQEFIYGGGHLLDVVQRGVQPVIVQAVEYRDPALPDPAPQLPMPAGKMPEFLPRP
jgi:hypothetical protein